jgi:putative flippase GtrA
MSWPQLLLRFVKFGFVGVLNTLVSLAVFNGLLFLTTARHGWVLGLITLVAYTAGITNSFFWNKWWVFRHGERGNARAEYVRFFGISSVVALVSASVVYALTTFLPHPGIAPALWANIAILVTFPLSMLGNFFAYTVLVFND